MKSNDFWKYAARYEPDKAKYPLENTVTQLNVLGNDKYVQDLEWFQGIFNEYYNDKVTVYDEFGHRFEPISISIATYPENQLKTEWETGIYDIYFEAIDLCDANAMIKNFGSLDQGCEDWADKIKRAANFGAYNYASYNLQKYLYENAYISYLGWDSGVVVRRQDVYGFDAPTGYYPFGDTSRLDFRYVYK